MTNIPKTIYLQIGIDCSDDEDFNDLSEVSWCAERINENDIEYVLKEKESDIISDAEIIENAKKCWQKGDKLGAVKIVYPFCHTLKQAKEYCEKYFQSQLK